MDLVVKLAAPGGFTTVAHSERVAALNHEILDDTMEDHTIVVALFSQKAESFGCFGSIGFK